jgi:hypothetical protein
MLSKPAPILSVRAWRRRVIVVVLAAGFAAGFAAGVVRARPAVTLVEACRDAARDAASEARAQLQVAGVCYLAFVASRDPATGARAARALAGTAGSRRLVDQIANDIGDSAAGADAWLAAGRARRVDDDAASAVLAYRRGLAHRAAGDLTSKIRDANGLLIAYQNLGDYQNALLEASSVYELSSRGASARERRMTLLNIAILLVGLGNLDTTKRLLDEAAAITTSRDATYVDLQELLGIVEHGRGHPRAARRALHAARDAARQHGRDGWTIYLNLLSLALDQDDVAAATELVARAPATLSSANDRAIMAYYEALLLVAQRRFRDAAQTSERARVRSPTGWSCCWAAAPPARRTATSLRPWRRRSSPRARTRWWRRCGRSKTRSRVASRTSSTRSAAPTIRSGRWRAPSAS